ncbi:hypothetical protein P691DRAFT_767212 [Macrolepiota fuliginosa MF-IS2]|uniref:Uncharacterized protein n=1 Tax=Macrolepiota fuliginosa MF-IS2 TaxID=1400762 RepID=A0A9P5WZY1_9AGAR|nr:hypothetical protein P691DRAFT_767212 [Macrolepiota fuliginosa MF-IS2]
MSFGVLYTPEILGTDCFLGTGFKESNIMIDRIILLTVPTGLITSMFALFALILFTPKASEFASLLDHSRAYLSLVGFWDLPSLQYRYALFQFFNEQPQLARRMEVRPGQL